MKVVTIVGARPQFIKIAAVSRKLRERHQEIRGRCIRAYVFLSKRVWHHLPVALCISPLGRAYGRHLHALVRSYGERAQNFSTFFLRNRPELELMRQLVDQKPLGSTLEITVIACSKGAEVYSILWIIRRARPDLRLTTNAIDISQEILEFAKQGVYSRKGHDFTRKSNCDGSNGMADATWKDQPVSIFERMTDEESESMFELERDRATVKSWVKERIKWLRGDAADPELVSLLGLQDVVVANRFLCHMKPSAQEKCLRNLARLVKPGGYIFVSGVDLDVRTRIALELGWKPILDLLKEIHDGDVSLRNGWPLQYWGLEPLCEARADWQVRYASVFQIGDSPNNGQRDGLRSNDLIPGRAAL